MAAARASRLAAVLVGWKENKTADERVAWSGDEWGAKMAEMTVKIGAVAGNGNKKKSMYENFSTQVIHY